MEQLDSLLQLIARLQNEDSTARGRRLLLAFARESCHARLALLLRLDEKQRCLLLQTRDGRRPVHTGEQPAPSIIPLNGYFGAALHTRGLLSVADLHANQRALPEERYWAWPGGAVTTCAVGLSALLVLCFTPDTGQIDENIDGSAVLFCASLLSNYLGRDRCIASEPFHMPTPTIPYKDALANEGETDIRQYSFAQGKADAIHRPLPGISAEVERERERIARDMHDGPAQQFAAVAQRLEYAERMLVRQPQDALREIGRARKMLDEGLRELRQSIATLMPARLREQTFADALHTLASDYAPLPVEVKLDTRLQVPLALEVPIYRFTQEALNNVRKHAQATRACVRVHMVSGLLLAEVSDDGKGFDPDAQIRSGDLSGQHMGLRTMRSRVQEAGGKLDIQSNATSGASENMGTTVRASFPVLGNTSDEVLTLISSLTEREREVLRLIVDGKTNRAIAEQLTVSLETVKSHVHHIMQKLNARDRTQAAVLATRQRWV